MSKSGKNEPVDSNEHVRLARRASSAKRARVAWASLRALIAENLKSLTVAFITGAVGVIGFWLSPLRDIVAHMIWRESAEILLKVDYGTVIEGDSVGLRITVVPKSAVHVGKGVISITFDTNHFRLQGGQNTLQSPMIDGPTILPESGPIEFMALSPGASDIYVELRTQYGIYPQRIRITVEPAHLEEEATRENLTGSWVLQLGTSRGKMDIRQEGHTKISGSYFLDNGDRGVIDGGRDGTRFWGSYSRGNSTTRWNIDEANIITNGGYVELKGVAHLERATQLGWSKEGGDVVFYSTIAAR